MKLSDMLFANAMMGEGGGGGGSSDFSTAEVTITNNKADTVSGPLYSFPHCVEENALGEGSPAMVYPVLEFQLAPNASEVFEVPLYKGGCWACLFATEAYRVTGDIVHYGGENFFVTGNGTIIIQDSF